MSSNFTFPTYLRPYEHVRRHAWNKGQGTILKGPFKGIKCPGEVNLLNLLGVYEQELHGCIERACCNQPDIVIVVGAAGGLYAIGMAYRIPNAKVYAYESNTDWHDTISRWATLNDMSDRIQIGGECNETDLNERLRTNLSSFILCDIEGYEKYLLDPVRVPELTRTTMLVELHKSVHPGIDNELRARFEQTHKIDIVSQKTRSREDIPHALSLARLLPDRYWRTKLDENRGNNMSWMMLTPKK